LSSAITEPKGAVAVDSERLLCQHAALVHGIHVRQEQDPGSAPATKPADDRVARRGGVF
jgi:hypothetical protein